MEKGEESSKSRRGAVMERGERSVSGVERSRFGGPGVGYEA